MTGKLEGYIFKFSDPTSFLRIYAPNLHDFDEIKKI